MANTSNKLYPLQVTGTNVGTWGVVLNTGVFQVIDNNLGGTLDINVAGSSDVNLTASQASYLIHNLTGALTGDINYIFPALGGFYAINNGATGAHTVTVEVAGGANGIVIPQGTTATVYIDASTPAVAGFSSTQSVYTAASVSGTNNDIIIPDTVPADFSLVYGILLSYIPTNLNTTSITIRTPDGVIQTVQKFTPGGLINFTGEENVPGFPRLLFNNGSVWIDITQVYYGLPVKVSTGQSVSASNTFTNYIATAALALTIGHTTLLPQFWFIDGNALGGAITITPYSTDVINVNGATLSAGTSYVIPKGATFRLYTDAAGNLYVYFYSISLDSIGSTQGDILYRGASAWSALAPGTNGQILKSGGASANPSWTSALANGTTATTQAVNDISTKVATTAFANPASSVAASGYVTLPSGIILQWKTGTNIPSLATGGNTTQAFTFPLAFPTAVFEIIPYDDSGAGTGFIYARTSKSTSGCTINVFNASGGTSQGTPAIFAIGH